MPKRRTARQVAASKRNLERARQAQRRGNSKLGTTGTSGANSAIKSYRKGEAFSRAAGIFTEGPRGAFRTTRLPSVPTGKRLRRKRV